MPFPERVGIARGAIAECLCRADGHVEPVVLVTVGVRAIKNENLAGIHQSGTRQGDLMPVAHAQARDWLTTYAVRRRKLNRRTRTAP